MLETLAIIHSYLMDLKKTGRLHSWNVDFLKDQDLDFRLKLVFKQEDKTKILDFAFSKYNLKFFQVNLPSIIEAFHAYNSQGVVEEQTT